MASATSTCCRRTWRAITWVDVGGYQRTIAMPAMAARLSQLADVAAPSAPAPPVAASVWPVYADRVAYEAGEGVRYGTNVFLAIVDVPNTNTTAPVDGGTWRKLTLPPAASRILAGIVEIADNSELDGAAADNVAVSPKGMPRILKGC